MSRFDRRTGPLETTTGILTSYPDQIEPLLTECEIRGRRWAYEVARESPGKVPRDADMLELHRQMFDGVLEWAGRPRTSDVGAGGVVFVPWTDVRLELRLLGDDLAAWMTALGTNPSLEQVAATIADCHHRFQWIHPFRDTNGRSGRVLDHYLLWVTFELVGHDFASSRSLEYFPDRLREDRYYDGLSEADNHRHGPLREYYVERLEHAFGTSSLPG